MMKIEKRHTALSVVTDIDIGDRGNSTNMWIWGWRPIWTIAILLGIR